VTLIAVEAVIELEVIEVVMWVGLENDLVVYFELVLLLVEDQGKLVFPLPI